MFRFTIRDLLWLTVVAALGVGWWVDRSRLAQRIEELTPSLDLHFDPDSFKSTTPFVR
ncbi:MAG TPA: hypothetical protein VMP01_29200 [Pirellulaceae bacterium]|nr:hypothetical protein [Pirellulaceae bacterium]